MMLRPNATRRLAVVIYQCLSPSYLLSVIYSLIVSWRFHKCGKGLLIKVSTVITGHKNITIGNDFVSMGNLYLYANDGGSLEIGDNVDTNTNVQFGAANGRIKVGNDVMIASNVVIRAANHGMKLGTPMKLQPSEPGVIIIEDDVWIGSNAVIATNVTLARGTVVGAGAVVTRSTTEFSIVAGVPARKIGERV